MDMATQTPVTVAEKRHAKERVQEEIQVHPCHQPRTVKVVGLRIALAQKEKGIENY